MPTELLVFLVPIPPLVAFALIVFFTNRNNRLSHIVGIGAMFISWLMGMVVFIQAVTTDHLAEHPITASFTWLTTGESTWDFGILIDPISAVTLFFVIWTCLMIFIYSIGYHNFGKKRDPEDQPGLPPHSGGIEPMYARFFAFISLFAFAMLLLVVSDNLLLLFIGWEIMGLCSYLLIGFWYGKESARAAMVKAFMTTRVGDVFLLLGLAYLYLATGTFNFHEILTNEHLLETMASLPAGFLGLSVAGAIGILIFIGTVGKSAQWPLHVWLPDAMEGPTPVSAMIHAATMVSAGVYLIVRFFPLLTAGYHAEAAGHAAEAVAGASLTPTMLIIAFIGSFTAVFAATIALAQNDVKRVLAYSTISQLGYMVAAIGIGAYVAAAFHLFTHAFFKALLFLGSGSVIHGMEHGVHDTYEHVDPQDMFNMGGLRKKMPITYWTFLIGGLALSGFPLITAGFWSKDEILAVAYAPGFIAVFITLAIAALLTAFYTARQISLTFLGEPRTSAADHAHESVRSMTIPLVILSFFAITAGWIGVPENFPVLGGVLPDWFLQFVGSTYDHPELHEFNPIPLITSGVVALGGLLVGWLVYRNVKAGAPDPLEAPLGPIYRLLKNKYYFDEIYDVLFVRPARWIADTFTSIWIDKKIIDGFLHAFGRFSLRLGSFLRNWIDVSIVNGLADRFSEGVKRLGFDIRVIQTGRLQEYLLVGAFFTGLLLIYFLIFMP
ncbi:MAG: NADH-quinone oxidoreductase subunit L [Anaerolineales bacterium]|nr:NADH-quinone oxidoreductase subunit L [Anaerolineales bacterium]